MGMYDIVDIYKTWLPSYEAMNVKSEWQTKSLDCLLNIIRIDKDGNIFNSGLPINPRDCPETMEIHAYDDGIWWSYILYIENGKVIKVGGNNG